MTRFNFSAAALSLLTCLATLLLAFSPLRLPASAQREQAAADLLARVRAASGGQAWDRVGALAYEASQNSSGMKGHSSGVDDVRTGRMRRDADYQVVRFVEVWDGTHHWRQEMSGGVHALDSEFAQKASATDAWLARRAYLKPGAEDAVLGPVTTRDEAGRTYEIVSATPAHGQPIELWFDRERHLLSRTVRVMPTTVQTVNYADYKEVAGVRLPHRITVDEGTGDLDTLEISAYRVNPKIGDVTFEAPRTPNDASVAGGEVTVPVEINGYVTLEASLNGKGPFAFLFDTGGHAILTPAAAASLGLHPAGAGSSGGAGSGRLSVQYAMVDRMEIGGVTFKQQNFLVIPLQYNTVERGQRTPLAGILGLEILERLAVRLDYRNRKMTFWPNEVYHPPGSARAEKISFTDDIPLLRAELAGVPGEFALDTGNGGSLVVQHIWAEQHRLAETMKQGIEMVSFGSGGESRNWASRITSFQLAGHSFANVMGRYAEDKEGAFASRTEAGNIGAEILENFTLDFDYAHSRIWFEFVPGFEPKPFPRSGMSFNKKDPASVVAVNVIQDGPAAKAGLKAGDALVTVAGKSAAATSREELVRIFTQAATTAVPVTYKREGREASTVIVLREVLP